MPGFQECARVAPGRPADQRAVAMVDAFVHEIARVGRVAAAAGALVEPMRIDLLCHGIGDSDAAGQGKQDEH